MRFRLFVVAGVIAAVGVTTGLAAAGVTSWGSAIQVPGTAALNTDGDAEVNSMSCGAAGNCSAGGFYAGASGIRAYLVSAKNGSWGTAVNVPGLAALTPGFTSMTSMSCTSVGNCSAGGFYYDEFADFQSFVIEQSNGTWGTAKRLNSPYLQNARLASISCVSAGNCWAGGSYSPTAFVAQQANHIWKAPIVVKGLTGLMKGAYGAEVLSVSCSSTGSCALGGYYNDLKGRQAFVALGTSGGWGKAVKVPYTATLNTGGDARVTSVSCVSNGTCSAGGYYTDGAGHSQAFVVNALHTGLSGVWGQATKVPLVAARNLGGDARVNSVSCGVSAYCSAVGTYRSKKYGPLRTFAVSRIGGNWGTAHLFTSANALSAGLNSISCVKRNCTAGGVYRIPGGSLQALVVSMTNGIWDKAGTTTPATTVPGTQALNTGIPGWAEVTSASCPSVGKCALGGFYYDSVHGQQVFVTVP